jgi:hypothetical protein
MITPARNKRTIRSRIRVGNVYFTGGPALAAFGNPTDTHAVARQLLLQPVSLTRHTAAGPPNSGVCAMKRER